jgi:hypothetical protein
VFKNSTTVIIMEIKIIITIIAPCNNIGGTHKIRI